MLRESCSGIEGSFCSLCAQLSTEKAQYLNTDGQAGTLRVFRVVISVYSENHRMVEAGRDYWKLSCPTPLLKQGHLLLMVLQYRDEQGIVSY